MVCLCVAINAKIKGSCWGCRLVLIWRLDLRLADPTAQNAIWLQQCWKFVSYAIPLKVFASCFNLVAWHAVREQINTLKDANQKFQSKKVILKNWGKTVGASWEIITNAPQALWSKWKGSKLARSENGFWKRFAMFVEVQADSTGKNATCWNGAANGGNQRSGHKNGRECRYHQSFANDVTGRDNWRQKFVQNEMHVRCLIKTTFMLAVAFAGFHWPMHVVKFIRGHKKCMSKQQTLDGWEMLTIGRFSRAMLLQDQKQNEYNPKKCCSQLRRFQGDGPCLYQSSMTGVKWHGWLATSWEFKCKGFGSFCKVPQRARQELQRSCSTNKVCNGWCCARPLHATLGQRSMKSTWQVHFVNEP